MKQVQSQQYRHQSDIIDITLLLSLLIIVNVPISHPAAISTFRLQADKCRHSRYFLALEIKQNLRILTVK